MLLELAIHNFAIIEDIELDFKQGMTVLTGETGAGKSIIIDAVGLLAGGRGSASFVRHGTNKCVLEGHFTTPKNPRLKQLLTRESIDYNSEVIVIQREIYHTGRSVCRVNGSLVTISLLKEIGAFLIDIHGQNEHQELMQSENHSQLLDYFGDDSITSLKESYQEDYEAYKETKRRFNEWQNKEQEIAQKIDILRFQTTEIAEADLVVDEEEELEEEERRLANFQDIMEALTFSYQVLRENDLNALEMVGEAMDEMKGIEEVDQNLSEISKTLSSTFFQLQEVASEIYNEMDQQEFDEERLNEIASRLNLIQQLKRKYGSSIPEILEYYEESMDELAMIENSSESKAELTEKMVELEQRIVEKGKQLSKERRKVSTKLEEAIHEQLKALHMDKADFVVQFQTDIEELTVETANAEGLDRIEFFISTNPGEPLKPLTKVASGGELSRMMLALKTIFAKSQGITSIIFDEIDTGVSGRVAQAIAEKIYSISVHSQVLCITHLPQVAGIADYHLYVKKATNEERTTTAAVILQDKDRIEEIARMLSGSETTEVAMQAAAELIKRP